jgi:hypothetical protein
MSDVRAKARNPVPNAVPAPDHRSGPRSRQLKSGIIVLNRRCSTLACTIRDIGDSGARLRLGTVMDLADEFELIFLNDRKIVTVRKCWHIHPECGVMFTGLMRAAPPLSTFN